MSQKDLVVKTNRLNTALQNLTLPELRIVQLAIVDARETGKGLHTDTPLRIDALRYAEAFETTRQNGYMMMKEAEETLFNRRFSFVDEHGGVVKSRWIQQVRYLDDEGAIELVFTVAVVKGITRIDGAEEFFTQYLLSQTAVLNSVYSIRLYELLTQWRSAKQTPLFELDVFRGQMGIGDDEYLRMSDLKKRVLDLAIDQINEKTDLQVSYEQHKRGRFIIGFSFKVREKAKPKQLTESRDPNTADLFSGLTDKQASQFAAKLSRLPELADKAPVGSSYEEFARVIAQHLQDPVKQADYVPYLKSLGLNFGA